MRNSHGSLIGKDQSKSLGVDGKILELILGKESGKLEIVFIWLRIETSGGLL
jgi:hypothetical protein